MTERSNDIQATTLDYCPIHGNSDEGHLWRRPAEYMFAALAFIVAIGAGTVMATVRSATVGITPSLWLIVIVPMTPVILMGLLVSSGRATTYRKRLIVFIFACLIAPIFAGELWFGVEESLYRQNVTALRLAFDYSNRWWPFESSGLVWNGTSISAHD